MVGHNEVPVLRNLNLEINKGEMLAVVGKSGAGKSTLLHIIGTLEKPTAGEVFFEDHPVFNQNDQAISRFRNRNMGFVFQMHHLLPEFTAIENVLMPAFIAGESKKKAALRAKELMALAGVDHRCDHRPGELSGGEQQRVAIARSLILNPSVVLADEPTGNLDTSTGNVINDLLFEINERFNTTMIVVTHNESLADRFPKTIQLKDGKIV